MSNHTLTPGQRVEHDATGELGTLTSTNGVSAVVQWDTTGGKNPADILPVTDLVAAFLPGDRVSDRGNGRLGAVADDPAMTAEYPGMVPVHWDNGYRTVAAPSILAPVAAGIEGLPASEIAAELERRGVPLPPAGFHPDTTGTTALVGPGYATDSWRVLTQWTPDAGVTYCIDSDHGIWTAAEVAELPKALASIRREMDRAASVEYLRTRPELASKKVTVTELCQAAEAQGIGWGAMAEAWGIVTGNQL